MILWTVIPNEDRPPSSMRVPRQPYCQRIPETYCWMMVPTQESPDADETMNPIRLQSSSGLAERAFQGGLKGKDRSQASGQELSCVLKWIKSHCGGEV